MSDPRERLSRALRYEFDDAGLLTAALTHRSARGANNERLEFLGDAVLDLIIAEELYRLYPQAREGDLSRLRASLVKRPTLAAIANELSLGDCLSLGSGEMKSGGHRRSSILSDALEAIIGAIYLDSGLDAVRSCLLALFAERLENLPPVEDLKDAKTRLQEWLQGRGLPLPRYKVTSIEGEAHEQKFGVCCSVNELGISLNGEGSSRRRAEQAAASAVLEQLVSKLPTARPR